MKEAIGKLKKPWLSVKEVATALGYEDPFHFSRVFKSVVRVAPTEYRVSRKNTNKP
jgi:AraC-like DNA-binding protein